MGSLTLVFNKIGTLQTQSRIGLSPTDRVKISVNKTIWNAFLFLSHN